MAARRIDALEGLRGVAVALVVLCHADIPGLGGAGWVGVNTFFVISGFIITHLLVREQEGRGRIALPAFFARRLLRLIPALVVMLAVMGLVVRQLVHRECLPGFIEEGMMALAQMHNWAAIYAWCPQQFLGHCWSLSIEWQFYLLWPLLLVATLRGPGGRARAITATIALGLASLAWAWVLEQSGASFARIYGGSDTRITSILAGCLVGLWWRPDDQAGGRGWDLLAPLALLALAGECWWWSPGDAALHLGLHHPLATAAATLLVVILLRRPDGWLGHLLAHPAPVWLGTISYGVYLWNYPIATTLVAAVGCQDQEQARWWLILGAVPLSVLAGWLSWVAVERPCQRLRQRAPPA